MTEHADLVAVAQILQLRAQADDPLNTSELRELVLMLFNIAEGRGALQQPKPVNLVVIEGAKER